jgi:hypothetical protein
MNSKMKVFTVVLATLVVAATLLYMPLTSAAIQAFDGEASDSECPNDGLKLIWWLLNNSEPQEVEGNAITFFKDFLIVDTADGQVRIALPEEWTVGTNIVSREMLFGSGYLSVDENVTVKTLRTDIIEKQSFNIYLSIGYEIVDSEDVHAYAALPVNIET